jgi:hypothetical protein
MTTASRSLSAKDPKIRRTGIKVQVQSLSRCANLHGSQPLNILIGRCSNDRATAILTLGVRGAGPDSLDSLLKTLGKRDAVLGVDVGESQRAVLDELGILDLFDREVLVLGCWSTEGDGSEGQRSGKKSVERRHRENIEE